MNWAFWISIAVTYTAIIIVFVALIAGAAKVERQRKCMMRHPAGKQQPNAHSQPSWINETTHKFDPLTWGQVPTLFDQTQATDLLDDGGR